MLPDNDGRRLPVEVASIAEKEWNRIAEGCSWATFFHTSAWLGLVADEYPDLQVGVVGARTSSGMHVILPLMATPSDPTAKVKTYEAGPLFTYGGPIADEGVDAAEFTAVAEDLLTSTRSRAHSISLNGNPYRDFSPGRAWKAREGSTRIVDLTSGFRSVRKRYSKGHRGALKKAEASGIEVGVACTEEAWREYFGLYEKSMRRWGDRLTIQYGWSLFARLRGLPADRVRLWLARRNGRPCAGAIVFYHGDRAFYWHGAADEACFPYRASQYLQDRIMLDACERGLGTYDMLGSGGREGVEKFKAGFGAQRLSYASNVWHCGVLRRARTKVLKILGAE